MEEKIKKHLLEFRICKKCNEVKSINLFRITSKACRVCCTNASNEHLQNNNYYKDLYIKQRPERLAKQKVLHAKYTEIKKLKKSQEKLQQQELEAIKDVV